MNETIDELFRWKREKYATIDADMAITRQTVAERNPVFSTSQIIDMQRAATSRSMQELNELDIFEKILTDFLLERK